VVVGDASGVDKSVQSYLHDVRYDCVKVFCSGDRCRNNVGRFQEVHIDVASHLKGRAFYAVKDKAMANISDYGFVIWDGKSLGTYNNAAEMLRQGKHVLLYLYSTKEFLTLKVLGDLALRATKGLGKVFNSVRLNDRN